MSDFIASHETSLRLSVFAAVLLTMMLAETLFPRKARALPRGRRWFSNLSLVVVDSLVLRLVIPVMAVGVAAQAQAKDWGILNMTALPAWLEIIAAIIILDMLIYWQHVATHRIPILWRLHKVHHADRDIDVTTGSRFHPLEILFSMLYKIAIVMTLGAPVIAVIIFEIVLNACAMFNHANLRLPKGLDKAMRIFIVTPDFHRVHHSIVPQETNSNYGFSLTVWDHLFRSYRAQPQDGHDGMTIGLSEYQTKGPASLSWSLALPFKAIKKFENWL